MVMAKSVDKWKTKRWFNVYAPEILGGGAIGEIPAADDKSAVGRIIKVNMSWITNKPQHSFIVVGLRVTEVNGDAANTQLKYFEQTYSYLHSLVKRHSSIIYTIDKIGDKDGKPIVLKFVIVTKSKVTTPKIKALRKEMGVFAKEYVSGKSNKDFIKEVLDNNFQTESIKRMQNIAEVGRVEVKRIEV